MRSRRTAASSAVSPFVVMIQFVAAAAVAIVGAGAAATPARAQTDYYNTDAGRPVRIEDAYPTELYAFELQLAPLRFERTDEGVYHWEIAPEIAYGVLPRTHLEIAFPFVGSDSELAANDLGLAGIQIGVLHNLNVETQGLPAFAIAADVVLPVGGLAPERVSPSLTGVATRTFRWGRVHANAEYTFGEEPGVGEESLEASRWLAGLAFDRTLPLRSLLLIGAAYVDEPLGGGELEWNGEAGARYQMSPFFALDAGIGRRFSGERRGWFVTFGAARAFSVRSLMTIGRR